MATAMAGMTAPFRLLDPFLIWFYRITGNALADFLVGTLILALLALIFGKISVSLAFLALRKRLSQETGMAATYQDLSMEAIRAGDKTAYQAANRLANDAFGKCFFTQMALSAGLIWPLFIALAWMQYRFLNLEFPIPFSGYSLGYIGIFILLYITVYLLFRQVSHWLPVFRRLQGNMANCGHLRRGLETCAGPWAPADPGSAAPE